MCFNYNNSSDKSTRQKEEVENEIWNRKGIKKGKEIYFLCPIPAHNDHNPSCRWNSEKQVWFCDVCGIGGGWKSLAIHLGVIRGGGYV